MKLDEITNKKDVKSGDLNPNDEFYTPEYAIAPLLKYLKPNSNILCPFDTDDSHFVKVLRREGHKVTHSHILEGSDFFKLSKEDVSSYDYIISNPPYSLKYEVFKHLFYLGRPFAMLVGVVGLFESQKRFELFKNNDFEIMYFNKRISYFTNYKEEVPSKNPPFSSVYLTSGVLPNRIIFEYIQKTEKGKKRRTGLNN